MFLTKEGQKWQGTLFGVDCEKEAEEIIKNWGGVRPNKTLLLEEIKRINKVWEGKLPLFEYLQNSNITKIAFDPRSRNKAIGNAMRYGIYYFEYTQIAFYTNGLWFLIDYLIDWDDMWETESYDGFYLKSSLNPEFWEIYDLPNNYTIDLSEKEGITSFEIYQGGEILLRLVDETDSEHDPIEINTIRR